MSLPIEERSELRNKLDPKNPHRTVIHLVAEMDVAGHNGKTIAEKLGYTQPWVSRIQNSPWYKAIRDEKLKDLHEQVIDKTSSGIVDADKIIKEAKGKAAQVLVDILDNGKSEAVKAKVASDIVGLNRDEKGQTIIVQINEKLGERMQKVLNYRE